MINSGKTNEMPAQAGRLTEAQIHVLAAYVWGLSNKPARPSRGNEAAPELSMSAPCPTRLHEVAHRDPDRRRPRSGVGRSTRPRRRSIRARSAAGSRAGAGPWCG